MMPSHWRGVRSTSKSANENIRGTNYTRYTFFVKSTAAGIIVSNFTPRQKEGHPPYSGVCMDYIVFRFFRWLYGFPNFPNKPTHTCWQFQIRYLYVLLCRIYRLDAPTSSVITGMRGAKAGVSPPRLNPPCMHTRSFPNFATMLLRKLYCLHVCMRVIWCRLTDSFVVSHEVIVIRSIL